MIVGYAIASAPAADSAASSEAACSVGRVTSTRQPASGAGEAGGSPVMV